MYKKILLTGIGIVFIVGIVWFSVGSRMTEKPITQEVAKTETVTVGVEVGLLTAPIIIAQEKGYFKAEGLDVKIKPYQAGKLALAALLAGEPIDMATVGPVPIALRALERNDFSILTTFVYSENDDKIVARKDKGIIAGSDLKGKKIGVTLGTSGHFFLYNYLLLNGASMSDVHVVDMKPDDLPTALLRGDIDAISTWEPRAYTTATKLGANAVKLLNPGIFRETFNLVGMRVYMRAHPETIKRFIRALDTADTFIKEHPQEARSIIAEQSGVDIEAVQAVSDAFVYGVSLDQSLLLTLEDIARWAIKNKLSSASRVPNFLDFLYLDALKDVKPESVSITH